jgi:hypothetical protein
VSIICCSPMLQIVGRSGLYGNDNSDVDDDEDNDGNEKWDTVIKMILFSTWSAEHDKEKVWK